MSDITVPRQGPSYLAAPPAPAGMDPDALSILVVDDEEAIRIALSRYLRNHGYEVLTAASGDEALEVLRLVEIQAMFCDVRMPGLSGLQVVKPALALREDLAIVMLSAVNDAPTAAGALTAGAMEYLTKPVELADLGEALRRVLRRRSTEMERRAMEQYIRAEVALRTAELERERNALRNLTVSIVETLINAQEAKDVYLRGHSQRVAELGAAVAAELSLPDAMIEDIRLAGRLHDVGKIGVREEILNKPGRLDPDEYEHVKDHVRVGIEILAPLRHLVGPALQYVQDHHEYWNGSGYPRGLAGEEISLGGRVLCVCDAFDALTSLRPYREPLTTAAALAFLSDERGHLVDARVVAALHRVVERQHAMLILDDLLEPDR